MCCLWLLSCYYGKVSWLPMRLNGTQILEYLLPNPVEKKIFSYFLLKSKGGNMVAMNYIQLFQLELK